MRKFTPNPKTYQKYILAALRVKRFYALSIKKALTQDEKDELYMLDAETWPHRTAPSNHVARMLGVPRRTMQNWIRVGHTGDGHVIRSRREGRDWYVCVEDAANAVEDALT